MCDPPGEVQEWTGCSKIQRVIYQCGTVKIITTVIQAIMIMMMPRSISMDCILLFLSVVIDEF